jgi:hypothetical protein
MCEMCETRAAAIKGNTEVLCVGCATDEAMAWHETRAWYGKVYDAALRKMERTIAAEKAARAAATA